MSEIEDVLSKEKDASEDKQATLSSEEEKEIESWMPKNDTSWQLCPSYGRTLAARRRSSI